MSIPRPVMTLSILGLFGTFALSAVVGLTRPAGAGTAFINAGALSAVQQRLVYLQTLPRHRSAVQWAAVATVPAATGAPRYSISPVGTSAMSAVALSQSGSALLNGGGYNYVAFVNTRAPVLELAQGCSPACDPLGGGSPQNYMFSFTAYALNNVDSVVGAWEDSNNKNQGMVDYSNSYFIRWTLQGRTASAITQIIPAISKKQLPLYVGDGINDYGVSVGYSEHFSNQPNPGQHAAGFIGNKVKLLATVPSAGCRYDQNLAAAINDAGTIVGYVTTDCTNHTNTLRAVRFLPDGPAEFLPSARLRRPRRSMRRATSLAIGVSQLAIGAASHPSGPRIGVCTSTTRARTVYIPQVPAPRNFILAIANANAVNHSDEVVGTDFYQSGMQFESIGLLYSKGRTYDLNALIPPNSGWQIVDAAGINDQGEILGDGYYRGNLMPYVLKLL